MTSAIHVKQLTKTYRNVQAVQCIGERLLRGSLRRAKAETRSHPRHDQRSADCLNASLLLVDGNPMDSPDFRRVLQGGACAPVEFVRAGRGSITARPFAS